MTEGSYSYLFGFKDDYVLFPIETLQEMYTEALIRKDSMMCILIRTVVHNGLYRKE